MTVNATRRLQYPHDGMKDTALHLINDCDASIGQRRSGHMKPDAKTLCWCVRWRMEEWIIKIWKGSLMLLRWGNC